MNSEDVNEEAYERGRKTVLLEVARRALEEAHRGEDRSPQEALLHRAQELQEARNQLRHLFEELEIEWPGDDLHLADVIEKHLWRHLR